MAYAESLVKVTAGATGAPLLTQDGLTDEFNIYRGIPLHHISLR